MRVVTERNPGTIALGVPLTEPSERTYLRFSKRELAALALAAAILEEAEARAVAAIQAQDPGASDDLYHWNADLGARIKSSLAGLEELADAHGDRGLELF